MEEKLKNKNFNRFTTICWHISVRIIKMSSKKSMQTSHRIGIIIIYILLSRYENQKLLFAGAKMLCYCNNQITLYKKTEDGVETI